MAHANNMDKKTATGMQVNVLCDCCCAKHYVWVHSLNSQEAKIKSKYSGPRL